MHLKFFFFLFLGSQRRRVGEQSPAVLGAPPVAADARMSGAPLPTSPAPGRLQTQGLPHQQDGRPRLPLHGPPPHIKNNPKKSRESQGNSNFI